MQIDNPQMKKRMKIMLISVGILFGGIFIYKVFMNLLLHYFISHQSQIVTVSAMKVNDEPWYPKLNASASLRAMRGINVTTELSGMVQTIYFTPGSIVTENTVLVQLKAVSDIAALQALQANAELAKTIYTRDKAQYAIQAISKAALDADAANLKSLEAQVAQQAATVNKKTIRAPFAGRLGISAINPGQYVAAGDKVVTLQQLDPIYVDFYIPQEMLTQLKINQEVDVKVDAYPDKIFAGKITTINPIVDTNTRNIEIEATVTNSTMELVPGMFATVDVHTGGPKQYLTLPQTAISYNPYGDIAYVIKQKGKGRKAILTVSQIFVITGETRGDQIQILKGLKKGDQVVTSGQLKLNNGSQVVINNSVIPTNNSAPIAADEY